MRTAPSAWVGAARRALRPRSLSGISSRTAVKAGRRCGSQWRSQPWMPAWMRSKESPRPLRDAVASPSVAFGRSSMSSTGSSSMRERSRALETVAMVMVVLRGGMGSGHPGTGYGTPRYG